MAALTSDPPLSHRCAEPNRPNCAILPVAAVLIPGVRLNISQQDKHSLDMIWEMDSRLCLAQTFLICTRIFERFSVMYPLCICVENVSRQEGSKQGTASGVISRISRTQELSTEQASFMLNVNPVT